MRKQIILFQNNEMNKIKKISKALQVLFVLAATFSFNQLIAQNTAGIENVEKIFPGSPEAFAMTEYARTPVDYYTGLAKIEVPLLELEGRSFKLPITLNYHSAGNKVSEISSSIGLGWTLNAGGVITRVVRGLNDDNINGYVGVNNRGKKINEFSFNQLSNVEILNYSSKVWDSEPDIYYFSFMGNSGRFVLDKNGTAIMTPENDFKVISPFGLNPTSNYWTIIDKSGNRYKFGMADTDKESSKVKIKNGIFTENIDPYISSWYLSEIEIPGKTKINFFYKSGLNFVETRKNEEYRDLNSGTGYNITTVETETISPKILERITSELGYLRIYSTNNRLDALNLFKIYQIALFDFNNNLIKGINFNQGYFEALNNCTASICKRLKLESIYEFYPNNISQLKNSFVYNSNKLPNRESFEIDNWGYYNANGLTNMIARNYPYNINAYKYPNLSGTKANILEEIHYSTGGYTKFNYELNTYNVSVPNIDTGGLRISSIEMITGDPNSNNIIENFAYLRGNTNFSSGKIYNIPVYVKPIKIITGSYFVNQLYSPVVHTGNSLMSTSYNNIFDLNGSNIGYSEVTVSSTNNGSETYKFTDVVSNPDVFNTSNFFNIQVNNVVNSVIVENLNDPLASPFSGPSQANSYQRGLLKEKITKNSSGDILRSIENFYEEKLKSKNLSATGLKFNKTYLFNNYNNIYNPNTYTYTQQYTHSLVGFDVGIYSERNGNYRLASTIEKEYYNATTFTEKQITYNYSMELPTSIVSEEQQMHGDNYLKTYEYANSSLFNINPNINAMRPLNMYDFPIVETSFKNNRIVSKIYNEYFVNNGLYPSNLNVVKLRKIRKLEIKEPNFVFQQFNWFDTNLPNFGLIDNRLSESFIIHQYDEVYNITEYSIYNGMKTCSIWGYNKSYPIAKIENASYSQIQSYEANLQSLSNTGTEADLRTALNALRTSFPAAMITTYTYKPLIGVSTITDPKGDTTFYTYDELNRLKNIKDKNGNVLTENQYHYKN